MILSVPQNNEISFLLNLLSFVLIFGQIQQELNDLFTPCFQLGFPLSQPSSHVPVPAATLENSGGHFRGCLHLVTGETKALVPNISIFDLNSLSLIATV